MHLPVPSLGAALLIASTALAPRPLSSLPASLQPLVKALQKHGFRIRIELPPVKLSYGLYQPKQRTIWVSPLAFELGIGRQTFVHEAVHAVQSCSDGVMKPLGWKVSTPGIVMSEINRRLQSGYPLKSRAIEKEAFAIQGLPDAEERLIKALRERCPVKSS